MEIQHPDMDPTEKPEPPVKLITQAERVFRKFGGVMSLFRIFQAMGVKKSRINIYRWNYPRARGGSDGLIPTAALMDVMRAARQEGIILTSDDLDPRNTMKKIRQEIRVEPEFLK